MRPPKKHYGMTAQSRFVATYKTQRHFDAVLRMQSTSTTSQAAYGELAD